MKIPRSVLSLLLLPAIVSVTGCPSQPMDDDSSDPAAGTVDSPPLPVGDWPADGELEASVEVQPGSLCPALPAEVESARTAFIRGDVDEAEVQLRAFVDGGGDHAVAHLLLGTLLHRRGEHTEAVQWLGHEDLAEGPLSGDVAAMLGESLEELDRNDEASEAYLRVPPGNRLFDRARVRLAALALDQGSTEDAITVLLPLLADPAELGSRWRPEGLLLLGRAYLARGEDGDLVRAYEVFRTAWSTAPLSSVAAEVQAEMDAIEDQVPEEHHPTVRHRLARAAAYHQAGHWNSTLTALDALAGSLPDDDLLIDCEVAYMRGRSLHKRKKYTEAGPHLEVAADDCAGVETDHAVKATFMRAQGLERLDQPSRAVATWVQLPRRFPHHSYADDGFLRAALIELDRDDPAAARTHLEQLVASFPEGDMFGEALWRLAWTAYRQGDQAAALEHLRHLQAEYPRTRDRKSYLRARYWEAKMIGWPDGEGAVVQRDQPGPPPDPATAAALFVALAEEHPLSWYGTLANSRLRQLDPAAADRVSQRLTEQRNEVAQLPALPAARELDRQFWDRPQREIAQALACAGMKPEAMAELRRARATAEPWDWQTEQAIAHLAWIADDPYISHNTIRVRFRSDHPERLTTASWGPLNLGYPMAYGANVRGAVADRRVPALLFQALVREESAFQREVKSWAGAMGLSQLMWATARETARKMGLLDLRKSDLADPDTNLSIGAFYLHRMVVRYGGNLPCAVGSYNAGPGAMNRWLEARSGYPLDEFVEDVPYKETRNYIKRVMESYQTYHHMQEGTPAFVELPLDVPVRE